MADLNGGRGKFQGVDGNVDYAVSFVGATKVAEKVKKGGTETKSDGYVVDAIDIDWGGLKLTTIDNGWNPETVSSTEQNAGKGENTQGIHSTAYLLNKISSSFTKIYNEIGGNDNAGLRQKIKTLETSIDVITGSDPGKLADLQKRIKQIEDELSNPGATTTVLSILDTLDGFDKTTDNVKDYIDGVRGTATDLATAYTVYGVRKYVDTTAHDSLIGQYDDQTIDTHYGVKFLSYYHTNVTRDTLIGESTDASTADTIWGAKNYADNKVKELDATVRGNLNSNDTIASGKKVGVKVEQVDGKLTGVTVVENDIASASELTTLSGTVSGHTTRIDTIDGKLADINGTVKNYVDTSIDNLDAEVSYNMDGDGEKAFYHVGINITQENGKISGVNVVEYDIASNTALSELSNTVSQLGQYTSNIDAKLSQKVLAGISGTVKGYVDDSIGALDATVDSTGGSHVAVQVVEEDGKVKTVTVTESNFDYEHITGADNKTLKETLENRDLAVSTSLTELDGRLDILEGSDSINGSVAKSIKDAVQSLNATVRGNLNDNDTIAEGKKVGVKVVEEKGKLTGVTVVTNDIASASELSAVSGKVDTNKASIDDIKTKLGNNAVKAHVEPEENGENVLVLDAFTFD